MAMNVETPVVSPAAAMRDPPIATPAADPVCRAVLSAADAVPAYPVGAASMTVEVAPVRVNDVPKPQASMATTSTA